MNKKKCPTYSRKQLCFLVDQWLESVHEPLFTKTYLNIEATIEHLKKTTQLNYAEQPLGTTQNHKIMGVMIPEENAIYIDPCLNQNPNMKRFTQAHEIAHWILHRDVDLADYTLADTEQTLTQEKKLTTTYDWVEWQANTFAAFLLVPKKRFQNEINKALKLLNIHKPLQELAPFEYVKIQKILAHSFQVSQTVIAIHYQHKIKEIAN